MFGRWFLAAKVMPLTMLGLLVCAGGSYAQPAGPQGMGWMSGGYQVSPYRGGYGGASYSRPSYYAPPTYYAPPQATPSSTATSYQSFYPPEPGDFNASTGASRDRAVRLNLSVPANAQIWIEDVKTDRTGTFRQFASPPIAPGQDYTYDIKVVWTQDGKEVTQARHLTVHAGDVINLTFNPRDGR
jgi:uncharacterized protein (TIGR03000 family)